MRPKLSALCFVAFLACALQAVSQQRDACRDREGFENNNQVDYTPLKVSSVSGVAIDDHGVPTPHACVLLFTPRNHDLISKTETDDQGQFKLTKIAKGRYRLIVKAEGFRIANVPLVVKSGAGAGRKRLVLHMIVGGPDSCSYGALE